jgi:hypothetical protein
MLAGMSTSMSGGTPERGDERVYDRNGLEVLDRDQCLALLGSAHLGRIGLTMGALPTVLPVNYWFDGGRILVRTGEDTKLHAAAHAAVVAFETDEIDPVYHSGWSVVVTGRAQEVADPIDLERLHGAPLARWAPYGDGRVVAIELDIVSGRRIVPGHPPR